MARARRTQTASSVKHSEGAEHLAIKTELAACLTTAGADVTLEATGPEGAWRADVLATHGARRIAFEVQWTAQASEAYAARSARYRADGVEVFWIVRHGRNVADEEDTAGLGVWPIFELVDAEVLTEMIALDDPLLALGDAMRVRVPGYDPQQEADSPRSLLLSRFVGHVLAGNFRQVAMIDLAVYEWDCWACDRPMVLWHMGSTGQLWARERVEGEPVCRQLAAERAPLLGLHAPLAEVRLSYGRDVYAGFHCPHCSKLQGSWHESSNRAEAMYAERGARLSVEMSELLQPLVDKWGITVHEGLRLYA